MKNLEFTLWRKIRGHRLSEVPVIGLVFYFWWNLIFRGIEDTIQPRWGALTFSYLNDGMEPTIFHTVMSVLNHPHWRGIYPGGAPTWRNRNENIMWEYEEEE